MECQTLDRYNEQGEPIYNPKQRFNTQDEAIEYAKYVNSLDHIIRKVVPYKCKFCGKYHLGRNGKILKEKERNEHKNQIRYEKISKYSKNIINKSHT